MINSANEVLQTMCNDLLEESMDLKAKLQNNLTKIHEIQVFLSSGKENKESDFDVFSPRRKELFTEKIEEIKKEKESIESENQRLSQQINKIDKRISDLMEVISSGKKKNEYMYLDIQEKERQRIARDLHDYSLQNLTHLIHVLELCSLFIDQDPARAKLELATASKQIKDIIEDIRNTIYDLRPMEFDDLGFRDALQNMVDKLKNESAIFVELDMEKDIAIKNELIFSNMYRIIKECVTNSIKHSEAKEIKIIIYEKEDLCHIEIIDNGKGFDHLSVKEKKKHFGLQIIEERIELLEGKLEIQSKENGTKISINIPING